MGQGADALVRLRLSMVRFALPSLRAILFGLHQPHPGVDIQGGVQVRLDLLFDPLESS